ncbi:MAG: hypothetical protein HDS75_00035 [Bacteroidales bacterium]|nr:hypothetical protein [Bacteroidales bacterium]
MKKERIARLVSARKLGGALLSLLMLVGLASCGKGDPNTLTLEVKPELRELGNFMSIESKEAVITLNEFTDDGEPRIRISSTLQVKVSEDVASDYGFDLEVVILDKNMNELTPFGDYDIEYVTDYVQRRQNMPLSWNPPNPCRRSSMMLHPNSRRRRLRAWRRSLRRWPRQCEASEGNSIINDYDITESAV